MCNYVDHANYIMVQTRNLIYLKKRIWFFTLVNNFAWMLLCNKEYNVLPYSAHARARVCVCVCVCVYEFFFYYKKIMIALKRPWLLVMMII